MCFSLHIICLQNGFSLRCQEEYGDRVAVRAALQDFAKCFSLRADLCTAWHLKTKLEEDEMLMKVVCYDIGHSSQVVMYHVLWGLLRPGQLLSAFCACRLRQAVEH